MSALLGFELAERRAPQLGERASLGHAAPAPEANLFEAGATSFDVVRFVDAARSAGFALAIADVFAAPSLAALGERAAHTAGQPATQARDAD
nr:acyl carrier protein [Burkholderia mallei]